MGKENVFDCGAGMGYTGGMKRIPCAFSVSKELLEKIDARAEALGLSRSAYIVQIVRKDLMTGSSSLSIVAETKSEYGSKKKRRKKSG